MATAAVFSCCLVLLVALSPSSADDGPYGRPRGYDDGPARPYNYAYSVHDDYAGTNFNANENSDGKNVKGSYQVLLPDGRLQVRGTGKTF